MRYKNTTCSAVALTTLIATVVLLWKTKRDDKGDSSDTQHNVSDHSEKTGELLVKTLLKLPKAQDCPEMNNDSSSQSIIVLFTSTEPSTSTDREKNNRAPKKTTGFSTETGSFNTLPAELFSTPKQVVPGTSLEEEIKLITEQTMRDIHTDKEFSPPPRSIITSKPIPSKQNQQKEDIEHDHGHYSLYYTEPGDGHDNQDSPEEQPHQNRQFISHDHLQQNFDNYDSIGLSYDNQEENSPIVNQSSSSSAHIANGATHTIETRRTSGAPEFSHGHLRNILDGGMYFNYENIDYPVEENTPLSRPPIGFEDTPQATAASNSVIVIPSSTSAYNRPVAAITPRVDISPRNLTNNNTVEWDSFDPYSPMTNNQIVFDGGRDLSTLFDDIHDNIENANRENIPPAGYPGSLSNQIEVLDQYNYVFNLSREERYFPEDIFEDGYLNDQDGVISFDQMDYLHSTDELDHSDYMVSSEEIIFWEEPEPVLFCDEQMPESSFEEEEPVNEAENLTENIDGTEYNPGEIMPLLHPVIIFEEENLVSLTQNNDSIENADMINLTVDETSQIATENTFSAESTFIPARVLNDITPSTSDARATVCRNGSSDDEISVETTCSSGATDDSISDIADSSITCDDSKTEEATNSRVFSDIEEEEPSSNTAE